MNHGNPGDVKHKHYTPTISLCFQRGFKTLEPKRILAQTAISVPGLPSVVGGIHYNLHSQAIFFQVAFMAPCDFSKQQATYAIVVPNNHGSLKDRVAPKDVASYYFRLQ